MLRHRVIAGPAASKMHVNAGKSVSLVDPPLTKQGFAARGGRAASVVASATAVVEERGEHRGSAAGLVAPRKLSTAW